MATLRSASTCSMLGRTSSERTAPELVASLNERSDPRSARLLVASAMGRMGATPTAIDDALRCMAEVHGNAIRHTQAGPISAQVWRLPTTSRALIAVGDSSPAAPIRRFANDAEDEGGRGLHIVETLSDACGYVMHGVGKVVWFAISLRRVEVAQLGIASGRFHTRDQRHPTPGQTGGAEGSREATPTSTEVAAEGRRFFNRQRPGVSIGRVSPAAVHLPR
ncbi:ATP-binding protein [Embleya sp. NPDC055664]